MPTIPQRVASAFAVLCGQYGDVTKMAKDREQSRQSLYCEAEQVANAVDGTAAQARIDELQRQLAGQRAEVQVLQERLKHVVEITPDKQHEFATVAQAEGNVTLTGGGAIDPVARDPGLTPWSIDWIEARSPTLADRGSTAGAASSTSPSSPGRSRPTQGRNSESGRHALITTTIHERTGIDGQGQRQLTC